MSPQTPGNEAETVGKNKVYSPSQPAARVWGGKGGLRLFPPMFFLQVGGRTVRPPFPQQKSPSSPKNSRRAAAWGPLLSVCLSLWALLTVLGSIFAIYTRLLPRRWTGRCRVCVCRPRLAEFAEICGDGFCSLSLFPVEINKVFFQSSEY